VKLIDADKLLKLMNDPMFKEGFRETMKIIIKNTPTVDAVPVVCGEWTTNSDYPDTVICSLCGWGESVWWADKGTNYCPNCGAKMVDKP
jgi:hypothetical protein